MNDLLAGLNSTREEIRPGMTVLKGFVRDCAIMPLIETIALRAPFRNMVTPGGARMSVAMTNCGPFGWVTDHRGYRYEPSDPLSGNAWPDMPPLFQTIAQDAADGAGFPDFRPDACLINRYEAGARMTAHQDRDEQRFGHPIVSVSIGLPATFFVHVELSRQGPTRAVPLQSGDVVVWGGPARLAFHGVRDLKPGSHPLTGPYRYNLTMRRAAE